MARKGLSRQAVSEAAYEIVLHEGFRQLSISNLANHLGIKPASLYNHIISLEDVTTEAGIAISRQLTEVLRHAAAGKTGPESLRALANAYRSFFQQKPYLYDCFSTVAGFDDPRVDKERVLLDQTFNHSLQTCGLEWQETIHFRRLFKSILNGFVTQEINLQKSHPLVWKDESFDLGIQVLIDAVAAAVSLREEDLAVQETL